MLQRLLTGPDWETLQPVREEAGSSDLVRGSMGWIERRFDMPEPLYAVSFGPIHTPTVLGSSEQMDRISSAFPKTIPKDHRGFFFTFAPFCRA